MMQLDDPHFMAAQPYLYIADNLQDSKRRFIKLVKL